MEEYSTDYQFNKTASLVLNFTTNSLSSLYFTAIKDRLYCDHRDSKRRISAQFTLLHIFKVIAKTVAPMVPHLAEELYSHLPQKTTDSFFKEQQFKIPKEWNNDNIKKFMETMLDVKSEINKEYGSETLGIAVNVKLPVVLFQNLAVSGNV